jgi:hypothetical protein
MAFQLRISGYYCQIILMSNKIEDSPNYCFFSTPTSKAPQQDPSVQPVEPTQSHLGKEKWAIRWPPAANYQGVLSIGKPHALRYIQN